SRSSSPTLRCSAATPPSSSRSSTSRHRSRPRPKPSEPGAEHRMVARPPGDHLAPWSAMPAAVDQRHRILATALELMGERGVAKTSMRRLASACDLNVATLYHYFPSKAELVRALLLERRYSER